MPPSTARYGRDQLVNIIHEFYKFLTTFYIPASSLKQPPPEGWPSITPETTAAFGKSPLVIDLLRHLPYIDEKDAGEQITGIHYKCDVLDWSVYTPERFAAAGQDDDGPPGEIGIRGWIAQGVDEQEDDESDDENDDESDEEEDDDWDSWPWDEDPVENDLPNIIALAQGYESGGRDIVLDVFKGVIYEDMLEYSQGSPVDVKKYFEGLRQQYENLKLVPIRGEMFEEGVIGQDDAVMEEYKAIYRNHGWPGDGFQKAQALDAVEALRECKETEDNYR